MSLDPYDRAQAPRLQAAEAERIAAHWRARLGWAVAIMAALWAVDVLVLLGAVYGRGACQ